MSIYKQKSPESTLSVTLLKETQCEMYDDNLSTPYRQPLLYIVLAFI